jgi:hypothetical protein
MFSEEHNTLTHTEEIKMAKWKIITFTGDVFYIEASNMLEALKNLNLRFDQVDEAGHLKYFNEETA